MTSITQTIPSLIGGISQQPDQLKLPGTCKLISNFIPDITEGLVKRPGSKFINALSGATSTGSWFSYYRDQSEGAYIGQIQRNGTVNMWKVADGSAVTVNGASSHVSYLNHSSDTDLKFLTVADTTFVTNSLVTVQKDTSLLEPTRAFSVGRSSTTSTDITAAADDEHFQTYVELRQVSHGREYAFDVASPSAPEAYTSGSVNKGRVTRVSLGAETDSPFYQASKTGNITDSANKVLSIDRNTSGNTYQGLDPELPFQGTEIVECTNGSDPGTGMIVRLTTVGQVNLSRYAGSTINGDEYVGIYNTSVELLHGGDEYKLQINNQPAFVTAVMKGVTYKIFIEEIQPIKTKLDLGTFRPKPTSFDGNHTISADSVLDLDEATSSLTPHVEKIGNGFFLSHNSAFNVTSPEPDLWRITSTEVNDVSELPRQCKNGMVVKVVNSSESQEDDFYLKFVGNNGADGPGKWEETLRPSAPSDDVHYRINPGTLPVIIQRLNTSPISFQVTVPQADGGVAWVNRQVGDDNTNPFPTFIGKQLTQTFFHRNRLGFLCDDNVILSQADDIYNFFNNTALVVSGNDPIDITSSSTQPTKFIDCIETNTGLLIFGETQQFMLHTDSDSLTPNTAKLSNISTYRYSPQTTPISLGTTVGFLDAAGSYSRFFEMFDIKREGEPQIVDVTKVVSKLLPNSIDIIAISRENNTIFFTKSGSSQMFLYRYFNTGSERLQGSWFTWNFSYNIEYTFILDDSLYLVSTDHKLLVINLQPEIISINSTDDLFTYKNADKFGKFFYTQIHLDSMEFLTAGSYNSADNTTTVSWPNRTVNDITSGVYAVDSDTGQTYSLKNNSGDDYVFHGNFAGKSIIIGNLINAAIELPTVYVKQKKGTTATSDVTASLVIQRIHFHFDIFSELSVTLVKDGGLPFGYQFDSIDIDQTPSNSTTFKSDLPQVDKNVTITIPVYQRNINFDPLISTTHPGPCALISMSWEGDYTPMNHKRV